jgi:hypothetical protein
MQFKMSETASAIGFKKPAVIAVMPSSIRSNRHVPCCSCICHSNQQKNHPRKIQSMHGIEAAGLQLTDTTPALCR